MKQSKTVLHHYLGTGLLIEFYENEQFGRGDWHEVRYVQELNSYHLGIDRVSRRIKPALHSMNRLTLPLENGQIPLIELAKICRPSVYWSGTEKYRAIGHSPVCDRYEFYYSDGSFYIIQEPNGFRDVPNQIQLFDYLRKNHFNLYNLPESEYIEKSTLKL